MATLSLSYIPIANSEHVYLNGVEVDRDDFIYNAGSNSITVASAQSTDRLECRYAHNGLVAEITGPDAYVGGSAAAGGLVSPTGPGVPGGVVAGDLLIGAIMHRSLGSSGPESNGWTLDVNTGMTIDGVPSEFKSWHRIADGTSADALSVNCAFGSHITTALAFRGASISNVQAGGLSTASTYTTPDPGVAGDQWSVHIVAHASAVLFTFDTLSGDTSFSNGSYSGMKAGHNTTGAGGQGCTHGSSGLSWRSAVYTLGGI